MLTIGGFACIKCHPYSKLTGTSNFRGSVLKTPHSCEAFEKMSSSKGANEPHAPQREEPMAETQLEDLPDILIQRILEIFHRNQSDPEQMKGWLIFKCRLNKRLRRIAKSCDGSGWLGPPVP